MIAHSDEHGPGGRTDHDLTQRYEAFTAKIEAAVDVEAGLRDILSQSRHEAFTAKIETALGVEAGLSDILTPPADQAPPSPSPAVVPPAANTAPGGSRWQASPAQRLKLRGNPRVAAASRVLHAVGNWISDSARDCDLPLGRVHVRALDLDLARARDLVLALNLGVALARVRDRARDLSTALNRAHGLDLSVIRVRDLARDLDLDLALALNRASSLARVRDLDRGLDRDLARVRDLARDLARVRGLDLKIVRDLDRALSDARTRAFDHARCRCLQIINDEYTQAIGTPVAVDEESLTSLMDDFTTDDLSDADVREDDTELAGVRWSGGTTWPASTDIDYLRRRSDRQQDGSWIIRAGTGNVRENLLT